MRALKKFYRVNLSCLCYILMQIPTPARLAANASAKLPRWALVLICSLFIFPGLIGRDIWKTEDAIGAGIMWTMVHGSFKDWLAMNITGIAVAQEGPLSFWLGAISMALFGDIVGYATASRLANLIWFSINSAAIWYASYLVARRPEAQPLALPFGGQPTSRSYGRMLADGALLLTLACLGLLWRSHESSAELGLTAMVSLSLYATIRLFDRPILGAVTLGFALAGAFLMRGLPGVCPPLFGLICLAIWPGRTQFRSFSIYLLLISFPITATVVAAWLLPLYIHSADWLSSWLDWTNEWFGLSSFNSLSWILHNLLWIAWPALPLAGWSIWQWRQHFSNIHIRVPLLFIIGTCITLTLAKEPSDSDLLPLIPPLVVLATLALPTLRRGLANTLDWFSLMVFSWSAMLIWLGWLAIMAGVPPKIAANFARQTPGFTAVFEVLPFTLALLASIAWIALISWHLKYRPTMLWRGTVLSAAGLTMSWLLLMTLWLPSIDYAKSYRLVSHELNKVLISTHANQLDSGNRPKPCMASQGLGLAQRASLAFFDNLVFDSTTEQCTFFLIYQISKKAPPHLENWSLIWEGHRASDRKERFLLYHRINTAILD